MAPPTAMSNVMRAVGRGVAPGVLSHLPYKPDGCFLERLRSAKTRMSKYQGRTSTPLPRDGALISVLAVKNMSAWAISF